MGSAVVRIGDKCSGHGGFPPAAFSTGGTTSVFVNGKPLVRSYTATLSGDSRDAHSYGNDTHHAHVNASEGSSTVLVEGYHVVRVGDHLSWSNPPDSDSNSHTCTSQCAQGSGDVFCG
jgi:uncharacterized Zn-binding protein involved in type VI secretion